jgi:ADP-heptose:LPS heptosyltransferase
LDREASERFFANRVENPKKLVVLHPGTSDFMPHKRWPLTHFGSLAKQLKQQSDVRILLSWGPGELPMIQQFQRELASQGTDAEIIPDTPSMKSLGFLLSQTDLVIGGDTGPIHLAVALCVPTIAILGPSDPRHYYPFGHPDRAFYLRAACSPCRFRACQDLDCLKDIEPHRVAEKALEILRSDAKERRQELG